MSEQPSLLTPILLTRSAALIVDHCIGVQAGDRCLVICDKNRPAGRYIRLIRPLIVRFLPDMLDMTTRIVA